MAGYGYLANPIVLEGLDSLRIISSGDIQWYGIWNKENDIIKK